MKLRCYSCGHENELLGAVGRRDLCERCEAELRCCLQCGLLEQSSYKRCREPQAEQPRALDRANFCDFFSPVSREQAMQSEAERAKAAFDALFRK